MGRAESEPGDGGDRRARRRDWGGGGGRAAPDPRRLARCQAPSPAAGPPRSAPPRGHGGREPGPGEPGTVRGEPGTERRQRGARGAAGPPPLPAALGRARRQRPPPPRAAPPQVPGRGPRVTCLAAAGPREAAGPGPARRSPRLTPAPLPPAPSDSEPGRCPALAESVRSRSRRRGLPRQTPPRADVMSAGPRRGHRYATGLPAQLSARRGPVPGTCRRASVHLPHRTPPPASPSARPHTLPGPVPTRPARGSRSGKQGRVEKPAENPLHPPGPTAPRPGPGAPAAPRSRCRSCRCSPGGRRPLPRRAPELTSCPRVAEGPVPDGGRGPVSAGPAAWQEGPGGHRGPGAAACRGHCRSRSRAPQAASAAPRGTDAPGDTKGVFGAGGTVYLGYKYRNVPDRPQHPPRTRQLCSPAPQPTTHPSSCAHLPHNLPHTIQLCSPAPQPTTHHPAVLTCPTTYHTPIQL
ncbi:basic proline-rich protein-like [Pezoporus flaviventris]|uniref:basic proline-rich protein-like n=1 Tax=Pezoporus flaviventris TaxID=889875 RepID=UPI002AB1A4A3|nr:basic proline-rich protein-like [Pezoporus flaviventris]